jgi:pilus assembly protein CpaE
MGYDRERIRLVLNRADSRVGITQEDVRAIVGRAPDTTVPSDRDIPRAVNSGQPLVLLKPRSDVAASFRSLAAMYSSPAEGANSKRSRRLLRKKG